MQRRAAMWGHAVICSYTRPYCSMQPWRGHMQFHAASRGMQFHAAAQARWQRIHAYGGVRCARSGAPAFAGCTFARLCIAMA
eukprot:363036-Chlamydomonas_euryale.AAC.3